MKTLHPIFENTPSSHQDIPYAWTQKGLEKGHNVTILGGIHGNEMVGVDIVQELLVQMQKEQIVKKGILNIALGNIPAIKHGKRYMEKDLNRCFASKNGKALEEIRAQELIKILETTDALLDIHSTIKPSEPFIGTPNPNHPLGKIIIPTLGLSPVLTGPGYADLTNPVYTDALVATHGGFGLTLEAGWSQNPKIMEVKNKIYAALVKLGIFESTPTVGQDSSNEELPQSEIYNVYWNVIAHEGFEFTKEWHNFEHIPAGTCFAKDPNGSGDLIVPEDSIIVFPKSKENIVIGNEACLIAQKKK